MDLGALSPNSPEFDTLDRVIQAWLQERQALIVALNHLINLRPFPVPTVVKPTLTEFCACLVDYASKGQFEVFEKIFEASHLENSKEFNRNSLIRLFQSTLKAVDFHDKYMKATTYSELEGDLSALSEALAGRLESEDELITLYMSATHTLSPKRSRQSFL